jgi:hypothetical protein
MRDDRAFAGSHIGSSPGRGGARLRRTRQKSAAAMAQ